MITVNVNLAERSYPIHIGEGLLDDGALIQQVIPGSQVAIITNTIVGRLYLDRLIANLPARKVDVLELPDGEVFKTLDTWSGIHQFLGEKRHNRGTTIVALGGGVVGDMAGFAAATWQRGVRFVQIPTTLLAQVDSSVGGKTGVNLPVGKNLVGAFWQPAAVLADTTVLSSLPEREYRAGLAEVLKYGIIHDRAFFDWLLQHHEALLLRAPEALTNAVRVSCVTKASVVARDEREEGRRAILNYGHTFGHAIESLSGYGHWLHGEAVGLGMVMAADLAARMKMLPSADARAIRKAVAAFGLPVARPQELTAKAMKLAFGMDKKVLDGRVRFVLATRIGCVDICDDVPSSLLDETLNTDFLCEFDD